MKISLKSITKKYNHKTILDNISCEYSSGACVAIIGKNGSGKSTLIKTILNLTPIDSGEILINDQNFKNPSILQALKKESGVLLSDDILIDQFTGDEYLEFISHIYKIPNFKTIKKDVLDYFFDDLSIIENKQIKDYSTGMRQLISIASCFMHKTQLLILDEPFRGLDLVNSEKLINLLNLSKESKLTFIASHNMYYIENIATHLLILDNGRIIFNGKKEDLNQMQDLHKSVLTSIQTARKNKSEITWL